MLTQRSLIRIRGPNIRTWIARRCYSEQTSSHHISTVKQLPSWDLETFQRDAFNPQVPAKLPFITSNLPAACQRWFIHDTNPNEDAPLDSPPQISELRTSFWSQHESTLVPLELTSTTPSTNTSTQGPTLEFQRTSAPLKILLTYLSNPSTHTPSPHSDHDQSSHSIYLAQCPLPSLPPPLQSDLPTPPLVLLAGKGDIYSSSLWLGRPPTYTPLHRDPNPNLFLQLAGHKLVRLFPPDVGAALFEDVQQQLREGRQGGPVSSALRGEEMMKGPEREELHRAVWEGSEWLEYAEEARVGLGEALFIPKGWWHSVKGVGRGLTASANWWFR